MVVTVGMHKFNPMEGDTGCVVDQITGRIHTMASAIHTLVGEVTSGTPQMAIANVGCVQLGSTVMTAVKIQLWI